jgi:hypothetical protein
VLQAGQSVTWIKVQKPTFDLVGVVLGAFSLAGVLLAIAFGLGIAFGVVLVLRGRSRARLCEDTSLHLGPGQPAA